MDKAVIYAKALTSVGIRWQIKKARKYADKHNLQVIDIHADYNLRTVDTNTQPALISLQYRAVTERFRFLLVTHKTIISKDVFKLIDIESYLDKLGIKILSVSRREF